MNKKNKYILGILISLVLGLSIYNKFMDKAIISGSDIKLFVTTDIHYMAKSLTEDSPEYKEFATPRDGKQLLYIDEIMEAFKFDIKNEKPDFLVISGDLTNNGEKASHMELADKLHEIEKMGVKVFVTPGNHDIKNMWARGFKDGKQFPVESIEQNDFREIYQDFGYKEAISMDETGLSYMVAPSEDLWLLMIDSNLYFDGEGMPTNRGIISPRTMEWIGTCSHLAKEKGAQIITIMHHNLLKHSERMTDGNTLENSGEAISLFSELDLNIVLSGHIHIQNIATNEIENNLITEIVTSSLAVYPQQYGVIDYSKTNGFNYKTAKVKVDNWAQEQKLQDNNLLNFEEYSKDIFYNRPYSRAYAALIEDGGYEESEMDQMSKLVARLNLAYFEGNVFNIKEEMKASPTYKLILDTSSDYVYDFVYSMMMSGNKDNSSIHIPIK